MVSYYVRDDDVQDVPGGENLMSPFDVLERIWQYVMEHTEESFTPAALDPEDPPTDLPFFQIRTMGGGDTEDGRHAGQIWGFRIEAGWATNVAERQKAWAHTDPNQEGSLHHTLLTMPDGLASEMSIDIDPDFEFQVLLFREGNPGTYMWCFSREFTVEVPGPLTSTMAVPLLSPAAIPPALPDNLRDTWGIAVDNANNLLYLSEGTPATIDESDIHSYDLSDNTRRAQEITAGISVTQSVSYTHLTLPTKA